MAANVTPSLQSAGPQDIRSHFDVEIVKLVGSSTAAGDTSSPYTPTFVKNPVGCLSGAFSISVSNGQVTFKSLLALGSDTVYVLLFG